MRKSSLCNDVIQRAGVCRFAARCPSTFGFNPTLSFGKLVKIHYGAWVTNKSERLFTLNTSTVSSISIYTSHLKGMMPFLNTLMDFLWFLFLFKIITETAKQKRGLKSVSVDTDDKQQISTITLTADVSIHQMQVQSSFKVAGSRV